jgi:hypothetical protein
MFHRNSNWESELSRVYSIPVLMAHLASTCHSGHLAMWCYHADTIVVPVSHDDVVVPIHCDSIGIVETSNGPFSVWMAAYASAHQSGYMALWCDYANTMVRQSATMTLLSPSNTSPLGLYN